MELLRKYLVRYCTSPAAGACSGGQSDKLRVIRSGTLKPWWLRDHRRGFVISDKLLSNPHDDDKIGKATVLPP